MKACHRGIFRGWGIEINDFQLVFGLQWVLSPPDRKKIEDPLGFLMEKLKTFSAEKD